MLSACEQPKSQGDRSILPTHPATPRIVSDLSDSYPNPTYRTKGTLRCIARQGAASQYHCLRKSRVPRGGIYRSTRLTRVCLPQRSTNPVTFTLNEYTK